MRRFAGLGIYLVGSMAPAGGPAHPDDILVENLNAHEKLCVINDTVRLHPSSDDEWTQHVSNSCRVEYDARTFHDGR